MTAEETGPGRGIGLVSVHGNVETDTGVVPESGGNGGAALERRENEGAAQEKDGRGGVERESEGPDRGRDTDLGSYCPSLLHVWFLEFIGPLLPFCRSRERRRSRDRR